MNDEEKKKFNEEMIPEGMAAQYGSCRFCGQMKMYQTNKDYPWSEERLTEAATRECDCEEAKKYTRLVEAREKAINTITRLFDKSGKLYIRYRIELDEALKEFMLEVVNMLTQGKLYRCQIDEGRVMIRIWMKVNGDIGVKWTYKDEEEEKVS